MAEPVVFPVAHDFTCEWCWVGLHQVKRLKAQFDVAFEWRGYEQYPESEPWPEPTFPRVPMGKPPTPTRLKLQLLLNGVDLPRIYRPSKVRTATAHQAVEYVKECGGNVDGFVEAVYRAYWERGENIADSAILVKLAAGHVASPDALIEALDRGDYRGRTIPFDAEAYKSGVFNIPTFWIGEERYAEQPYNVLEVAVKEVAEERAGRDIYSTLSLPSSEADRPYVVVNMVATIDGKIITGSRDEPVVDLGSNHDHALMKRIEAAVDAVILGAQTIRAAKPSWNPAAKTRVVVTRSGDLPFESRFFTEQAIVASEAPIETPAGVENLVFSELPALLRTLKSRGIERLLLLGGSTLNAQFFGAGLIDEVFLTVAPKIKLGKDTPTMADGVALPRERIQNYTIIEEHRIGDELFLRYRRIT